MKTYNAFMLGASQSIFVTYDINIIHNETYYFIWNKHDNLFWIRLEMFQINGLGWVKGGITYNNVVEAHRPC